MIDHDSLPPEPTPEQKLLDLLPLLAENLTPQLGYLLELSDMLLSDLAVGTDYQRDFSILLGHQVANTARFVYTYNALTDEMDIDKIHFGLASNLQGTDTIMADSVHLQRFQAGFVASLGLGGETLIDTPFSPQLVPTERIGRMLRPVNLFTLRRPTGMSQDFAEVLSRSDHWSIREQQTVPLPVDNDVLQHQLLVIRDRSVTYMGAAQRPFYGDGYELTFQSIDQPDENDYRPIDEETLFVRFSEDMVPIFGGKHMSYKRYDHPFVIGKRDTIKESVAISDISSSDIARFLQLIEQDYMA